jgi:hypothetical protein
MRIRLASSMKPRYFLWLDIYRCPPWMPVAPYVGGRSLVSVDVRRLGCQFGCHVGGEWMVPVSLHHAACRSGAYGMIGLS